MHIFYKNQYFHLNIFQFGFLERYCHEWTGRKPGWQFECELITFGIAFSGSIEAVMNAIFMTTKPDFELYLTSLLPDHSNLVTIFLVSIPFNVWLYLGAWAACQLIVTLCLHFAYITTAFLQEIK